jgi:hypothetical protein
VRFENEEKLLPTFGPFVVRLVARTKQIYDEYGGHHALGRVDNRTRQYGLIAILPNSAYCYSRC